MSLRSAARSVRGTTSLNTCAEGLSSFLTSSTMQSSNGSAALAVTCTYQPHLRALHRPEPMQLTARPCTINGRTSSGELELLERRQVLAHFGVHGELELRLPAKLVHRQVRHDPHHLRQIRLHLVLVDIGDDGVVNVADHLDLLVREGIVDPRDRPFHEVGKRGL